jgi:acyl-CoA reductase-like NAD-dependent aldehyde dehydrogenase
VRRSGDKKVVSVFVRFRAPLHLQSIKHCNWFGAEAGQALATSKRIAKLSFTGSGTGRK